ncbi:ubiquitin-conjugating enzyme (macronuclear) [Tetrahymena thermophila SB210]|uniref:Ubiquitin-conjugating enzyme n=1 Tax=Tetrahymena thermophila (strain SB210) TaxID=312017 RepID=Q247Y5_TETTS|nr:ubiquitin-conjugating enzyme [Tetrahymena thermophila SB210]EAS04160.1 ubiquitin-conjugating enzyme [Tetrahymena thermophila SB210]|eukprot:XP_001024405.1 ubiquitin-conjugating enzyme [Tetrahymena thermophila SB210]
MLQVKKKKEEENKRIAEGQPIAQNVQKVTPGLLRLQKDLEDLDKDLPNNAKLVWPDKQVLTKMELTVWPDASTYWGGAKYLFTVEVGADYPHQPPKVHCHTKIYHPNIDLQGNVCLNILRADWKPVLNLYNIISGVLFLFIEPNPNDPLNKQAASQMINDIKAFEADVKKSLRGGQVGGEYFPKLI